MSIIRIWHGKTALEQGDHYLKFLLHEGTQGYRETSGNLSIKIWSGKQGDAHHFFTVTEWENLEAIKNFAGEDYHRAVYYPQDQGVLLEFEESVKHYTCIDVSNVRIKALKQQMEWLLNGGSWQGQYWVESLSGITPEMAFHKVSQNSHNIAEIVWHCLYWRTVLIHRAEGDHRYKDRTVKADNFRSSEALRKLGWENLVSNFLDSTARIISMLESKTDAFLDEQYEPGYAYQYVIGLFSTISITLARSACLKRFLQAKMLDLSVRPEQTNTVLECET